MAECHRRRRTRGLQSLPGVCGRRREPRRLDLLPRGSLSTRVRQEPGRSLVRSPSIGYPVEEGGRDETSRLARHRRAARAAHARTRGVSARRRALQRDRARLRAASHRSERYGGDARGRRPYPGRTHGLLRLHLAGDTDLWGRERRTALLPPWCVTLSDFFAPTRAPDSVPEAWIAYQTNRSGVEGVWLIHPD